MTSSRKKAASSLKTALTATLVILLLLMVFFLPLAIALVLAAALLYYWWLAWTLPEPRNAQDFTFTATELDTFAALEPRAKNMQQELSALWKQGAHLSKRKDGYFSERSKLGKRLNPQIQQLEEELGEDKTFIVQYSAFSEERQRHYIRIKSRRMATTLSTLIFGSVVAALLHTPNSAIETISKAINEYGLILLPADHLNLWGAMAAATVLTLVLFMPIKALSGLMMRLKLTMRSKMDINEAITFSGHYATRSGIGEA